MIKTQQNTIYLRNKQDKLQKILDFSILQFEKKKIPYCNISPQIIVFFFF